MRTTHTSKSHSRGGSHISQRQNDNKAMQREIDDLEKKLRCAQRKRSPSSFDVSSNDEEDTSYRRRSRTPPSEGQELYRAKSATISENTRAHLAKVWEMML